MRRDAMLIPIYLWVSLSLVLHLFSYVGTNELAEHYGRRPSGVAPRRSAGGTPLPPSEIEFESVPSPVPPALESTPPSPTVAARPPRPRREEPTRPRPAPTTPRREEPRAVAVVPTETPPAPRTVSIPSAHYVHQESNTQEPTPTNPHFLAQSNHDVEEETVARIRNLQRDEANPELGGTPHNATAAQAGNGDHDVSADQRNVQGDRSVIPHEAPRPRETPPRPASTATLRPAAGSSGDPRRAGPEGTPGTQGTRGDQGTGTPASTQGDPSQTAGTQGEGGQGGQGGAGGQRGDGSERVGIRGLGAARALQALTPDMSTYSAVFGAEEIERQRRLAAQRRSEARGSYVDSWRQTRAAIENYTPTVRVGNQTALRTAASPFAGYLTAMHRRIHRLFSDDFLGRLDALPRDAPLNDTSLVTTLEIVLERDGSIHRLGVVSTSGQLPFDVAAVSSVRRAAPFGNAPAPILSGDGRVYLRWGFYRNERQCGTFNAEPYILPNPGAPGAPPRTPPTRPPPADEHPPAAPPSSLGALPRTGPPAAS